MTWVKSDDTKPLNRKVRPLSDAAYRLDDQGLHYCARHETDGLIWLVDWQEIALGLRGKQHTAYVGELVSVDLWHPAGATCESIMCPAHYEAVPDSAWIKHDYFEHNKTHAELQALRDVRQDSGRIGGFASGRKRRAASRSKTEANAEANAEAKPKQMLKQVLKQNRSKTEANLARDVPARTRDVNPSRPVPSVTKGLSPPVVPPEITSAVQLYEEITARAPSSVELEFLWRLRVEAPRVSSAQLMDKYQATATKFVDGGKAPPLLTYLVHWAAEENARLADQGVKVERRPSMVSIGTVLEGESA